MLDFSLTYYTISNLTTASLTSINFTLSACLEQGPFKSRSAYLRTVLCKRISPSFQYIIVGHRAEVLEQTIVLSLGIKNHHPFLTGYKL